MSFKVGDMVKVTNSILMIDDEYVGKTYEVETLGGTSSYCLKGVDVCMRESQLKLIKGNNMKYEQGQILELNDYEYKILAVVGEIYFLSESDDFDCADEDAVHTQRELDDEGYELKDDSVKEVTLDEIADKFGVSVENIRVKKDD